jgi:DNA modification methylase
LKTARFIRGIVVIIKANSLYVPLKDKSVQSIITSPPYWGLRDYDIPPVNFSDGWNGQLGQEPTPKQFIEHLMLVMGECWRVLRDDGVCWINLGDTFIGGGMSGHHDKKRSRYSKDNSYPQVSCKVTGMKRKSLAFIPERFAITCLDAGWIIRNKIIWHKPNGMPDSVTDRFTVKHEVVYMLVKKQKYFFDLDAVRVPHKPKSLTTIGCKFKDSKGTDSMGKVKAHNFANSMKVKKLHPVGVNPGNIWQNKKLDNNHDRPSAHRNYNGPSESGVNPGDLWEICPQKYPKAHFATFPEKLAERMLLCSTKMGDFVLDPFGGSGTVGRVAIKYRRKPVLLDMGYHELQVERMRNIQQRLI